VRDQRGLTMVGIVGRLLLAEEYFVEYLAS
jgi:hypothetical protein